MSSSLRDRLARPVVNFTPGAGKLTAILIDRSASMQAADVNGHTRLDEAKRRAKALAETLILGLRTADGVPSSLLAGRVEADVALRRRIAAWREQSLLVDDGARTRLTDAGFLLSDALFVELL